jgi:hypothetical protein
MIRRTAVIFYRESDPVANGIVSMNYANDVGVSMIIAQLDDDVQPDGHS